ncbi:immunoglobulin-like domain-containing protein [Bacillus mycoides]|uniref:immunoglobulin-like domain-containing protein n=1 Tax=Bacillus mycoides TaxID=1405 RepID=UPI002ABE6562|nr:immunoglobulin-like domain-containing protein [Bacillus mycoides]
MTESNQFDPMAGVSATDKEGGVLTSKVTHEGTVDISKAGTYEVIYSVKDLAGNEVTTIQKVVVKDKDNGNGSDNGNNGSDNNNGNNPDKGSTGTNNSNASDTGKSKISNNSTSDKKEDTYKELPKTGASTNNSAAMGLLMVLAGMALSFGRKFRKVLK